MKVTVGISAYNLLDLTKQTLDTMFNYVFENDPHDFELVVVDDCSTDGTQQYLNDYWLGKYIRFDKNKGAPTAWNTILDEGKDSDLTIILNNDVIPGKNWLSNLVKFIEGNPDVGLCSSQIIDAHNFPFVPNVENKDKWFEFCDNYGPKETVEDGIHGCCIAITKDCREVVGYFDTAFKVTSYEDCDYVVRATRAGFLSQITHSSLMWHAGGKTQTYITERDGSNWFQEHNKQVFQKKYNINLNGLMCNRAIFWDISKQPAVRIL